MSRPIVFPFPPLSVEQRDAILAGFAGLAPTLVRLDLSHVEQTELKAA